MWDTEYGMATVKLACVADACHLHAGASRNQTAYAHIERLGRRQAVKIRRDKTSQAGPRERVREHFTPVKIRQGLLLGTYCSRPRIFGLLSHLT